MAGGNTVLQGIVSSGIKEGAFFMSLEPYLSSMRKKLGYTPFKGTFNIKVDERQAKNFIDSLELINIVGFKKGIKEFGDVKCYPCQIKKIICAITIPEFTRHDLNTIEIISEKELRSTLNLKDGDKITISK